MKGLRNNLTPIGSRAKELGMLCDGLLKEILEFNKLPENRMNKQLIRSAVQSNRRLITASSQLVQACLVQLNVFNASSFACDDLLTGLSHNRREQIKLFPKLRAQEQKSKKVC